MCFRGRFLVSVGLTVSLTIMLSGYGFAQKSGQVLPSSVSEDVQSQPFLEAIGKGGHYTLGTNDVVEITVRNQPEFSGRFVVGPDGNIQYIYLGDIKAEGLAKEELREVLAERLKKFVKTPEVSVAITAYLSKNVYVLGEVARPGKYAMQGDALSLRDAIVEAGLPTRDAALRRVYVIKSDSEHPEYKKIDIFKIFYKGITKDNVDLVPGDIVYVPSTVPAEFRRAFSNFLSPFNQATDAMEADRLINYQWGVGN